MDAEYWNKKYDTDELVYTDKVNMFVEEYCSPMTAGTAIDLAGGEGRNAVWLAQRGWQVEDIDFSHFALAKFLKLAEARGVADKVSTVESSALDFDSNLAPVDLGLIGYLQIPKADLSIAIKRLIGNIKPGGTLLGVWHCRENLVEGFGGPQDPAVLPNVEDLTEILAGEPVEIEVLKNRDGLVQTKDGYKPSIVVVLKARKL